MYGTGTSLVSPGRSSSSLSACSGSSGWSSRSSMLSSSQASACGAGSWGGRVPAAGGGVSSGAARVIRRCSPGGGGAGVCAARELVEGVGEAGFVGVAVAVAAGDRFDVLPGGAVERLVDVVAVDPRDLCQVSVGQADPDLADPGLADPGLAGVVGVGVASRLPPRAVTGEGWPRQGARTSWSLVRWSARMPRSVMACQRTGSSSRQSLPLRGRGTWPVTAMSAAHIWLVVRAFFGRWGGAGIRGGGGGSGSAMHPAGPAAGRR